MICSLGSFEITSRGVTAALVATYRLPSLPTVQCEEKHPTLTLDRRF